MQKKTAKKSGFVVLIGRSNSGKSTLLNTLVGTKISATSFKPQMTRNIIHGVLNTKMGQAVFLDTPGMFKQGKDFLSAKLINRVRESLSGADIVIYVTDPSKQIGDEEKAVYGMIRHLPIPKFLVINKCDLHPRYKRYQEDYERMGKDFDDVFILSAEKNRHIQPLKDKIMEVLPEGEPFYPEEQLTNVDRFFWVEEIIREKIFSTLEKEVPYSITVKVDNIEEKPEITVITARILTEVDRHKKIIIGRDGRKIKEIGQMARRELEQALNKKVFLELEVEKDTHWVERV